MRLLVRTTELYFGLIAVGAYYGHQRRWNDIFQFGVVQ
jgi:hypothetical protein